MCTLGDAADVNPVPIKFLRHALQRLSQELDWNGIDIRRVTKGAHIKHL
jgi:hypothetical protein